jgi:hypothetical protein
MNTHLACISLELMFSATKGERASFPARDRRQLPWIHGVSPSRIAPFSRYKGLAQRAENGRPIRSEAGGAFNGGGRPCALYWPRSRLLRKLPDGESPSELYT